MRAVNWSRFTAPADYKETSAGEWHGPCPVTGEGKDTAWLNVGAQQPPSCRTCGDGSGRITGEVLAAHARAFGIWDDVDLGSAGPAGGEWESWTFTTADGRERQQYRTPDGKKWRKKGGPWPAPADLLYLPGGALPAAPGPVYLTEGASDADALHAIGLAAISRSGTGKPSRESLARFDPACRFLIFPDHDDNGAGYRQAIDWAGALTAAGLEIDILDPLELQPDAPSGYDARDWAGALPEGATADAAGALLAAAVADLDTIKGRVPGGAVLTAGAPAVAPLEWQPPADGLPIPRQGVELCDSPEGLTLMLARRSARRLRYITESGEWIVFADRDGWHPVPLATVEEAIADCARQNIGSRDKLGEVTLRPAAMGRRAVARDVAGLLAGRPEVLTTAADWDAAQNLIVLPDGDLLNVLTGARQRPSVDELHRRRVSVEPASPEEFAASMFRIVIEHAVPDPAERTYLQRRLGAALVDAEGMDDLIWLFGPPGCGKGTLTRALIMTLEGYAAGVPVSQILKGGASQHPAWLARTAGCRTLIADDVPVGRQLNDATINMLLGSQITAHHMRGRPFDFSLRAPLLCTSNAPPQSGSTNVRRLRPIQCGAEVRQPDPQVRASMSSGPEVAACLRWLLDGAGDWQRHGCPVPASIRERADDAAADSLIAEFMAQFDPGERIQPIVLLARWRQFQMQHGMNPTGEVDMRGKLESNGWKSGASNGKRYWTVPPSATPFINPIHARNARAHTHVDSIKGVALGGTVPPQGAGFAGDSEPAAETPRGGEPAEPAAASGGDDDGERRGRIAFRDSMPAGAHHPGCTLPAEHGGPCWIPEPAPEPLTDGEQAAIERLPRVPAITDAETPDVRRYNAVRSALGLEPVSLDAQPGDRAGLDASAFVERLGETARRADAADDDDEPAPGDVRF